MKLLDLFSGSGGSAMGYYRAGFTDITGVDIKPMPRYPFRFVLGDALEYLARLIETGEVEDYALIHASPPCQGYSRTEPMKRAVRLVKDHPMLIDETRRLLQLSKRPYIIENVPGAPLVNPIRLTGAMFGLGTKRARLFECNPLIWFMPLKGHQHGRTAPRGEYDRGQYGLVCVAGNNFSPEAGAAAMQIDWMIREELAEAIPPAYTHWLGTQMLHQLAPAGVMR